VPISRIVRLGHAMVTEWSPGLPDSDHFRTGRQ
jgi:hypothetical protein